MAGLARHALQYAGRRAFDRGKGSQANRSSPGPVLYGDQRFHFVPSDPWQMSIMIKNWAIAVGCLILAAALGQ